MGVGVYSDDFNGTGGTFLVSGPLAEDDDYLAYLKQTLGGQMDVIVAENDDGDWVYRHRPLSSNADAPYTDCPDTFGSEEDALEAACDAFDVSFMGKDAWGKDEYDTFNMDLIECIERAGEEIGLDVFDRRNFTAPRAGFDDDFVGILDGQFLQVGWRSWEIDFVIGIGADEHGDFQDRMAEPDAFASDILHDYGRAPKVYADRYMDVARDVQDYIRLSLMNDGYDCRFRTSGYTTGTYEKPDDLDSHLAQLKGRIVAGLAWLKTDRQEAIVTMGADERPQFIKALQDCHDEDVAFFEDWFSFVCPVYTKNEILLVDPHEAEVFGAVAVDALPEHVKQLQSDDDMAAIPFDETTAPWFKARQQKEVNAGSSKLRIYLSGEEYVAASGDDFSISDDAHETVLVRAQKRALKP